VQLELSPALRRRRGTAVFGAVHPLPVRKLAEVSSLARDDETGGDQVDLARAADASAGGRVEVAVPLQIVALRAGVHQGESSDPETVPAGVVGSGRQPEVVDFEQSCQAPFVDSWGFITNPALLGIVESRDDEGLMIYGDERPDAVCGDRLGTTDRATPQKVVGRYGTVRAGPATAGGRRGHRVPSMNRADSASTSRRLHNVDHASTSSDSSSYAFSSEGARRPL
jgi:hypothetical protein